VFGEDVGLGNFKKVVFFYFLSAGRVSGVLWSDTCMEFNVSSDFIPVLFRVSTRKFKNSSARDLVGSSFLV